MLWVARVLLLFRLNSRTICGGTEHVFLQYVACTRVLDELDKELSGVYLSWTANERKDYSAVEGDDLDNRMELNVGEPFAVEPFSPIDCVVNVE